MPAPVSVAHTHVHSMRLASGEEALVARVLTAQGVTGFGFTLNFEAIVAREMAAWDAAARARAVPLYALFGERTRTQIEIVRAKDALIDPFSGEPLEEIRRLALASERVRLLAEHAHPWEIGYCAALAATLSGDVCIAVRGAPSAPLLAMRETPGVGVDWSAEPGFGSLRWIAV